MTEEGLLREVERVARAFSKLQDTQRQLIKARDAIDRALRQNGARVDEQRRLGRALVAEFREKVSTPEGREALERALKKMGF